MAPRSLKETEDDPTLCPVPDCGWAGFDSVEHIMNTHTPRERAAVIQQEFGEMCTPPGRLWWQKRRPARKRRPPST